MSCLFVFSIVIKIIKILLPNSLLKQHDPFFFLKKKPTHPPRPFTTTRKTPTSSTSLQLFKDNFDDIKNKPLTLAFDSLIQTLRRRTYSIIITDGEEEEM